SFEDPLDFQNYLSQSSTGSIETSIPLFSTFALASFTVSGNVKWEDVNGTAHNARSVKVSVFSSTGSILNTGYTDTSGNYSLSFNKNGVSYIGVATYSSSQNISVETASGTVYTYSDGTFYSISSLSSLSVNFELDNISDGGKAFQVHQALHLGYLYYSGHATTTSLLHVEFPSYSTSFSSTSKKIEILHDDANDWDVTLHEYGHFIADELGIISVGGYHYPLQDLTELYGKTYANRLAWSEAWATYFSISLQLVQNASSLNIPNVGDVNYTDTEDWYYNVNLETLATQIDTELYSPSFVQTTFSEASENGIISLLYDIADSSISEAYDILSYGHENLFDFYISQKKNTLSLFINQLYSSVNINSIGKLLEFYHVSSLPSSPSNNSFVGSTSPTLTWVSQGGIGIYQNNSFVIVITDPEGNVLHTSSTLTSNSYLIPYHVWNYIYSQNFDFIQWRVESYQTIAYTTGKYVSSTFSIYLY
ncbi:MAG: hypothetical protein LBM99_05920, partial [Bacillales bacterium]|nr:hypothetical protein [Bacillales bacterium]